MNTLAARYFVALMFLATAAVAVANPFKSKIIMATSSTLTIAVPDDHFLRIASFTQEGGTDRGVVEVTLSGSDTDESGTTDVLVATRIDLSTGLNAQNSPEVANRVVITGPATVKVRPVTGATLFISYKKELNIGEGGGGENVTPVPILITPTPPIFVTPTPTPTPGF